MIMKEHTHFREDGTEYTHVHHNGDGVAESHVHHHDHGGTGHVHRHVHSAEEKKKVMNRLSRAIGHLEAVKRMVVILKNHLDHCIVEAIEQNDMETIRALDEAIDKFIK